jgi:MoaA/NifB/PqqE/SkfB family radical SAM enzyme
MENASRKKLISGKQVAGKYTKYWSTDRTITRRGVLWIGLKCNLKCIFCYDKKFKNNLEWIPFDTEKGIKPIVSKFKFFYKNNHVDIMGGEPTQYPDIFKLLNYCRKIDLDVTIITHALKLSKIEIVKKYKDAGICDFLISFHGLDKVVNKLFGIDKLDITKYQLKALENLADNNIPFRFNVLLTKPNLKQLAKISEICLQFGGGVLNFINFNPYFEWSKMNNISFQAKFTEIASYLKDVIEYCNTNGLEVNVRYIPFCILKGYEAHIYTDYQLPYDIHEWDFNSWYDENKQIPLTERWYYSYSEKQIKKHGYVYGKPCNKCALRNICSGFHSQYVRRWGWDEAKPYEGSLLTNPKHFISRQKKIHYIYGNKTNISETFGSNFSLDQIGFVKNRTKDI